MDTVNFTFSYCCNEKILKIQVSFQSWNTKMEIYENDHIQVTMVIVAFISFTRWELSWYFLMIFTKCLFIFVLTFT